MKKQDFENLVESIRQAGRIRRGEAVPSRVTEFAPVDVKAIRRRLGKSQSEFARMIGVSPMRVSHVVKGMRPVTAELALLFGRAFGQSPQYWLNLQSAYDLRKAKNKLGSRLKHVESLVA